MALGTRHHSNGKPNAYKQLRSNKKSIYKWTVINSVFVTVAKVLVAQNCSTIRTMLAAIRSTHVDVYKISGADKIETQEQT